MKKKLAASAVFALILGLNNNSFAAENPFSDVPADHWARGAVTQLVHDGVIKGYPDGSFRGNEKITRFEMAQMVATAMASQKKLSAADKEDIVKLAKEFSNELDDLGVRVAEMEKRSSDVKFSGELAMKYLKEYGYSKNTYNGGKANPWWEKYLELDVSAPINSNGWTVHGQIESKLGAKKSNCENFNDSMDQYGGENVSHKDTATRMWVEGNMGGILQGQYAKFGYFQPWVQGGFISDARIKGGSLEHWGKKFATHVFYGRLEEKDWDLAVGSRADESKQIQIHDAAWNWKYITPMGPNPYGDFVRYHKTTSIVKGNMAGLDNTNWQYYDPQHLNDYGGDNKTDVWGNALEDTTKRLFGFDLDYSFTPKTSSSLGYYRYTSEAYLGKALQIWSVNLTQKLTPKLAWTNSYARGNQGGNNKAYDIELQYNGNPWIDYRIPHNFGAYIAYRYLGPDAIVKTNFNDAIRAGQKGLEIGAFYTFASNMQYTIKYGRGSSITNNNERRAKIFTELEYMF
ncbi:S-layer homology domain-containing protein [Pectinatus frisingensis]|uniref:S-layer homology domain-containing protein n=1 Tax=Pectinatus frisingensis TaxID=865 RepID=UPI0018C77C98|nr:S-layer homology domain-containing protein [Pectinatus frisingensis]